MMKSLATVVNFLTFTFLLFSDVESKSPVSQACGKNGVCYCQDMYHEVEVDCSGYRSGRKLHQIPRLPLDVQRLDLTLNSIEKIDINTFRGLTKMLAMDIQQNRLQEIPEDVFKDLGLVYFLCLGFNKIRVLHTNSFRGLNKLKYLDLHENHISVVPDNLYAPTPLLTEIDLGANVIGSVSNTMFNGITSLKFTVSMAENSISVLPYDLFSNVVLPQHVDLSDNLIGAIPPGIFNTNGRPHKVEILYLHRNFISHLNRSSFAGLNLLQIIFLFNNLIHTIGDGTFSASTLNLIYLFNNKLNDINGNPFSEGQNISEVHYYGNNITMISHRALQALTDHTVIYTNCYLFKRIPRDAKHAMIKCVSPSSVPAIPAKGIGLSSVDNVLGKAGFICEVGVSCSACPVGTFGNRHEGGCSNCSAGGFYQDDVGQAPPYPDGPPCKLCNNGTYVTHEHGDSIRDCQVCPEGTNKAMPAGYRACFCKENYARTDRFGPCSICNEDGLDCTKEYKRILPGYFWEWDFQTANLGTYETFVANLEAETMEAAKLADDYKWEIPRVHKCPRQESCVNNNGSIVGNCVQGYKGWLCASCESGYYAVLNECVLCPEKATLIMNVAYFLSACVIVCYLFSLQVKRDAKRNQQSRSLIDIIISRFKILLGFYQVVGELYASVHEVNWTGPLVIIGTFISSMEFNVLRLFVRPRCFDPKLIINPKMQFIITVSIPAVIILPAFILYQIRKVYLKLRTLSCRFTFPRSQLHHFKSLLVTCVVVLLFLIYPSVCTVIFELYPHTCETFHLDNNNEYFIKRLRSDLDFDCSYLSAYHEAAYAFTALYVVAFPTILLYLLWRNRSKIMAHNASQEDGYLQEGEDLVINESSEPNPRPVWFKFLCENYKSQYWFWEIIELSRKATQTMLVTLFGWENRLTVLLTTCISVLFLVLHARYRPMESLYEQRLQMFSLTAIFINVLVASNEAPEGYEGSISTMLIALNVIVMLIVLVEVVLTVIVHIKHACSTVNITSILKTVTSRVFGQQR